MNETNQEEFPIVDPNAESTIKKIIDEEKSGEEVLKQVGIICRSFC